MTELELPDLVFSRLRRYVEAGGLAPGVPRTHHWAFYAARNRIAFLPGRCRIRFAGGAGFDGYYSLNFGARKPFEWLKQKWTLWSTRRTRRLFNHAYASTCVRDGLNSGAIRQRLGEPLTPHKVLAAYYMNLIRPHLPAGRPISYLEIGAGTGYLAALLQHACPGRTIIVDLPEILPFSFIYLNRLFPKAAFQLPNEARDARSLSEAATFVFLSPEEVGLISDRSLDLAVNTASFGEMMPQHIATYFSLLRRALRTDGLFFTCNRVEKWMNPAISGASTAISDDGVPVRFEDYPWSAGDREVFSGLSKFHQVIQPENPFQQRLCHLAPQSLNIDLDKA
jgi:hypothetical protein